MDNYYVDKPLWRVDLGTKNTINGAVILTWQGAGQGMYNVHMYPMNRNSRNSSRLHPTIKAALSLLNVV